MAGTRTSSAKKGGAKSSALARVGDPLITDKGIKIEPEGYANGRPLPSEKPALVLDASSFRPMRKRNIKELPADTNMMNGVAVVFLYTLMGVGDREIADTLRVTVPEVEAVRQHSAYRECFDAIVGEFINKNSDLLAARIAAYSHSALDVVGSISMNGKKEETRLKASTDLLDRAGVRAKDVAERNSGSKANELRIVIVKPDDHTKMDFDYSMGEVNGDRGE